MKIDFTPLFSIGNNAIAPKTPTEATKEKRLYDEHPIKNKNGTEGQISRKNGISELQRELNNRNKDIERAKQVYKTHQENIIKSDTLRTEILKGVKSGQDITDLFLKAVETISLMTSDTVFYNQIKEDIKAIYGVGLKKPGALKIELEEIEKRLVMLQRPELQEEAYETKRRIDNAIRQHQERKEQIKAMLIKA